TPVRAPAASATPMPPAVTEYRPGAADSSACVNGRLAAPGSAGSAPVSGRNGKSPPVGQPTPDRWVRLNPVMSWSSYRYPPPDGRPGVSGLHCTMPKGVVAPGNASTSPTTGPPLPVPMKGLTSLAGSPASAAAATGTAATTAQVMAATASAPESLLDNVVLLGMRVSIDRCHSIRRRPAPVWTTGFYLGRVRVVARFSTQTLS